MQKELIEQLTEYIANIKNISSTSLEIEDVRFPHKNSLENNPYSHFPVLVEQAEKLLKPESDFSILGFKSGFKDRNFLIEIFINDLELFATKHEISIRDNPFAYYAQSKISDHAFFHLAASSTLPKTYSTIELNGHKESFDIYSIPFKIRIALENKIKNIIGFESCDIKRGNKIKKRVSEIPVSMIIQELIKLKCLDLPCSLEELSNIYSWSCSFCHTGEKEYIWMSLKAIEVTSLLFLHDEQKKNEIPVDELWNNCNLTPEEIASKLIDYQGFPYPLYYLKKEWSIEKLEKELNNTKNPSLQPYKFHLTELKLDEVKCFYCAETNQLV